MRKYSKLIYFSVLPIVIIGFFQNCGAPFQTMQESDEYKSESSIAPIINLTLKPNEITNVNEAVIAFEILANKYAAIKKVEYSLNSGEWLQTDNYSLSFLNLIDNNYNVQIRAIDSHNNIHHVDVNFKVDTTAPIINVGVQPSLFINLTSAAIDFSVSDSGIGSGVKNMECSLDGATFTACTSPHAITNLSESAHKLSIRATDNAGNITNPTKDISWTVDLTKPTVLVNAAPPAVTSATTAQFEFTTNDTSSGIENSECSLDGATFVLCQSPHVLTNLTAASHELRIRAKDKAGNTSDLKTVTWLIDVTAPTLELTSKPANATNQNSATFVFSGSDDGVALTNFECKLDNNAFASCVSPKTYSGLAEGSHEFTFQVKDAAGNMTSGPTTAWTVDLTTPIVTINSIPATSISKSINIVFTAIDSLSGVDKIECSLDSGVFGNCISPFSANNLADGSHQLQVRATDKAGNASALKSASWVVDTLAPIATLISSPTATVIDSSSATFNFSITDANPGATTAECSLDGAAYVVCTSPIVYNNLRDMAHVFSLRGKDAAGNMANNVTYNWSVLFSPAITQQPMNVTAAANTNVSFSVNATGTAPLSYQWKKDNVNLAGQIMPTLNLNNISAANAGSYSVSVTNAVKSINSTAATLTLAATNATTFAEVLPILQAKCITCHRVGGQAAFADFNFTTANQFFSSKWFKAGDITSPAIVRTQGSGAAANVATMPVGGTAWSTTEFNKLKSWILAGDTGSTPTTPTVEFTCTDANDTGLSIINRLSKDQYTNTLTDLFGSTVVANVNSQLSLLPNDNTSDDAKDLSMPVSISHIEAYMNVAVGIAEAVTANDTLTSSYFGTCALTATPSANDTCVNNYLGGTTYNSKLAQKIFRRPLTTEELTAAKLIVSNSGSYRKNLKLLLAMHLQSSAFLFRPEVGTANDTVTLFSLTPYEVATRIAFATTDSTPSDALLIAARDNGLSTKAQIETQSRNLFATTRGKTKLRMMIRQWLQQLAFSNTSTLPADLLAGINTTGLEQAISSETDQFIDYVVWNLNGGYKDLMTSKASFASHTGLATIYGHAPRAPAATNPETFAGRRQGILMRVPYLASARSRTALVNRGVKFRRRILCEELPTPSNDILSQRNVMDPTPEEALNLSTKDLITRVTDNAVCLSCHAKINPTGSAFENFDSIGRIRSVESIFDTNGNFVKTLPINTNALVPMGYADKQVTDGYDLITEIANSSQGPACLTRQAYRFFNQRMETPKDSCALDSMYQQLMKTNASILDAFVAAIANDASAKRRNGQ